MKVCLRFARLRVKTTLTNPFTLLTLFILPLLFFALSLLFFQAAISQGGIPVAIVDLDQSLYSSIVVDRIKTAATLTIVESGSSRFRQQILNHQVDCAIVLPRGFQAAIEGGDYPASVELYSSASSLGAPFIKEIVATQVMRLVSNQAAADWVIACYNHYNVAVADGLHFEAWQYTDGQWEPEPPFAFIAMTLPDYENDKKPQESLLPAGLLAASALIMLFVLFSSQWLLEDREEGRIKRLRAWGIAPGAYFLGCSLGGFILGCLQFLVIGGVLLYSFPTLLRVIPALLAGYVLQVIIWVSLSTLISAVCNARKHGQMVAIAFTLFTTVLATPALSWRGKVLLPQYWTVEAISGGNYYAFLYLSAIALVLMVLSYFATRWKYEG